MVECLDDLFSLSETYSTVNSIGIVDNFSKQKNGILHDDKETQSVSKSLASSLTASAREPQKKRHDEDKIWERLFSLFRLQTVLRDILSEEHNNGNQEEIDGRYTANNPTFRGEGDDQKCDDDLVFLHVRRRLRAVLMSKEYALHTMEMSFLFFRIVDMLKSL